MWFSWQLSRARNRLPVLLCAVVCAVAGCGGGAGDPAAPGSALPGSALPASALPASALPASALPGSASSGADAPPTAAPPAKTPPDAVVPPASRATAPDGRAATGPAPDGPAFVGTAAAVTAADLPHTWRPGCPVAPADLRLLRLSYWGFDQQPHVGTLVVHKAVAAEVTTIFATLFRERFAIRRMVPVDAYGGSDPASMAADNTSGFNCRHAVAPGTPRWSAHAYGRAIDVNPVENPYLPGGAVLPPAGAPYVDRSVRRTGMAVRGGTLVRAFAAAGWSWGGTWPSAPDYQHFSRSGG